MSTLTSQGIPTPQSQVYPYNSITTTGTLLTNGTITIDPNLWGGSYNGWSTPGNYSTPGYNTINIPTQLAYFIIDDKSKSDEDILMGRFNDIIGDEMSFNPQIVGKKMEPLETIMKYITSKKKFDVKLTRNSYEIKIKGVIFKKLTNMLSKDSDTNLKVSFDYDELVYDNTLLSLEEKRSIKVNELLKNIKKHDI